jgi:hypothetical protein
MDTAVAIADAPAENVLENALVMEGAADVATEIERNRKATRFAVAAAVAVADLRTDMARWPMDAAAVDATENTRPNIFAVVIVAALDTVAEADLKRIRP